MFEKLSKGRKTNQARKKKTSCLTFEKNVLFNLEKRTFRFCDYSKLSDYRKIIIKDIQTKQLNIESMTVFLNLVQESQELVSALRHTMRGKDKFEE